jgi:hypothetical protein
MQPPKVHAFLLAIPTNLDNHIIPKNAVFRRDALPTRTGPAYLCAFTGRIQTTLGPVGYRTYFVHLLNRLETIQVTHFH